MRPGTRPQGRLRCQIRRLGIVPGRRLVLPVVVSTLTLVPAGMARADQAVVSATIYPGRAGSVSTAALSLSQLSHCPIYSGSSPFVLNPSGQPFQPVTGDSWSLSAVLTCGLEIPAANVTDVAVQTVSRGFETPLSAADLTDPGQFHDSGAPTALPVISVDGTQSPLQIDYARPYRGGADANGFDHVSESGAPITLAVYENGAPLEVRIADHVLSRTKTAVQVQLRAAVRSPTGATIPPSALKYSWGLGDGAASSSVTASHSFSTGVWLVTVQVTDPAAGTGGTATLQLNTASTPPGTGKNQSGAGGAHHAQSPAGTLQSAGKVGGQAPDSKQSTGQSGQGHDGTTTATTTTAATATAATAAPTTTTPSANIRAHRRAQGGPHTGVPRPQFRRTPAPAATASNRTPLVTGELISDVTPVPASASPLVARQAPVAKAPTVREALRTSSLAAVAAALGIVVLLGLGAARELHGRRRWRVLHPPSDLSPPPTPDMLASPP